MLPKLGRQVRLKSRPSGIPQAEHFEIVEAPVRELREREFLVRNDFLSIDPAMRGWVSAVANYSNPVAIGEVMRSFAAGEVIASRHPAYAEGDKIMGMMGWQDYAISDGGQITRKVKETDLPLSLSLGILGLNGVTAYFALLDVGHPRAGDTVVVSTAAGAVGSAVGQIAKISGCRAIGIAGGPVKTKLCREEFGYDGAIDYNASEKLEESLAAAYPHGVDVYFDNTAGRISDAVLRQLAPGARAALPPSPVGTRRRSVRASSAISSSSERECRASSSSTISTATRRRWRALRVGCARAGSAIARTSSRVSRVVPMPSPAFIGARISASGWSGCTGVERGPAPPAADWT